MGKKSKSDKILELLYMPSLINSLIEAERE